MRVVLVAALSSVALVACDSPCRDCDAGAPDATPISTGLTAPSDPVVLDPGDSHPVVVSVGRGMGAFAVQLTSD